MSKVAIGSGSGNDDYAQQAQRKKQDPAAVVQTGPGLPDWQFQSWRLSWSGPVARDHHFELVILPPILNRLLADPVDRNALDLSGAMKDQLGRR